MKLFALTIATSFIIFSCKKTDTNQPITYTDQYTVAGNLLYHYNDKVQLIGTNAFHIFSAGGYDMNSWHIDIAREFVGNVKEAPLTGYPIRDANGSFLYSLQTIVDSNRANKRTTILCPFGWDGLTTTYYTGQMPAQTSWWNDYKIKLQQWATQFSNQPDVWLEVWNEPYRYDRTDGYTDAIWMNDMNTLVAIIRNTGNKNIILVPCAEQGQDESVLLNQGNAFLNGKNNILFDIHAYEKWLLATSSQISTRLQLLKQNNLPVIFGETAPMNAGVLMDPKAFLDTIYNRGLSVCSWVWKYDATDMDALLNVQGTPNNNNNNNWGTTYQSLGLKVRNP